MTDEERGSALCTACGLCCTGALHDVAKLDPDEVEAARAIGLPVAERRASPAFRLPCPKLDGAVCTIYGDRPRVCARYACRLLIQVRDQGMALDDAMPVVREAQRLAAATQDALGPKRDLPAARAALLSLDAEPRVRLHGAALALYIDRHFRNEREGPWLEEQAVVVSEGVKDV